MISDPELGYRLNPERKGNNELSVRGGPIAIPKAKDTYRIIYLGDSVTAPETGFVSYTREELDKQGGFEVINAGVPGYTAYQEVLFYRKYLAQTVPDLVIWVYCLNDNHRFLHRVDTEGRFLFAREEEPQSISSQGWNFLIRHSYVLRRIHLGIVGKAKDSEHRHQWEVNFAFAPAWNDSSWADYEDQLRELLQLSKAQGTKLAIVVVPYGPQLAPALDPQIRAYATKPQRKLASLCEKHGLPCLDMLDPFSAEAATGTKLYEDGIHLSSEGHRFATRQILQFLSDQKLLITR